MKAVGVARFDNSVRGTYHVGDKDQNDNTVGISPEVSHSVWSPVVRAWATTCATETKTVSRIERSKDIVVSALRLLVINAQAHGTAGARLSTYNGGGFGSGSAQEAGRLTNQKTIASLSRISQHRPDYK